jgi:tetratricopeptide (TPR) repeat protein
VCLWAGEWGTGERALLDGYRLLEEMGEKSFRSTVAAYLGEAVCRQGRFDEAERWSILSEELGSRDDRVNEASWRILRAKVRAARGDRSGGEELVREALEIAEKTDYVELAAAAWLDLAGILAADRTGEARSAAARAQALYERKGNIVGARRAAELVERLEGSSAADGAQPAADRP